jgi:hypothetical protein
MSVFHRRQAIAEVVYAHDNLECYAKLSTFIYNNYQQALEILGTRQALASSMQHAHVSASNFREWLEEEGEYLRSVSRTPPKETLQMEYYSKLSALADCEERLILARQAWVGYKPAERDQTSALETKVRNEQENQRKLIADIQALEGKLEISVRWSSECFEWRDAEKNVIEASYRKALDKLEGMLVARIFEMSRLNIAGTG